MISGNHIKIHLKLDPAAFKMSPLAAPGVLDEMFCALPGVEAVFRVLGTGSWEFRALRPPPPLPPYVALGTFVVVYSR